MTATLEDVAKPAGVRYYSDCWPGFETAVVLIPAEGDTLDCMEHVYNADELVRKVTITKSLAEIDCLRRPAKISETDSKRFSKRSNQMIAMPPLSVFCQLMI